MDLKLGEYNVRDATIRSLLGVAQALDVKKPTQSQQELLAEIADQLEARVQDELDAQRKVDDIVVEEESFVTVEDSEIFVEMVDGEVNSITHKGVVFGKFCNEAVEYDVNMGRETRCIKAWGHVVPEHEDAEGNLRL